MWVARVKLGVVTWPDLIRYVGAYREERSLRHGTAGYYIWADTLTSLTQMTDEGVVTLPAGVNFRSYVGVVERSTVDLCTLELLEDTDAGARSACPVCGGRTAYRRMVQGHPCGRGDFHGGRSW